MGMVPRCPFAGFSSRVGGRSRGKRRSYHCDGFIRATWPSTKALLLWKEPWRGYGPHQFGSLDEEVAPASGESGSSLAGSSKSHAPVLMRQAGVMHLFGSKVLLAVMPPSVK